MKSEMKAVGDVKRSREEKAKYEQKIEADHAIQVCKLTINTTIGITNGATIGTTIGITIWYQRWEH